MHVIDSLDDYKNNIRNSINSIIIDNLNKKTNVYSYNTSYEHPLICSSHGNILYINREFYEKNKKNIDYLVCDVLKNTTQKTVYLVDKEFINNVIIQCIIYNKNILEVCFEGETPLGIDDINLILSSHICHLSCNVDLEKDSSLLYKHIPGLTIINYPKVAGSSILNFGIGNVSLLIDKKLNEEELLHLKTLFENYPQEKVYVDFKNKEQLNQILNLIISKNIIIRDSSQYKKNELIYLHENYDNVYFSVSNSYTTDIKSLIQKEEIIETIITEVNGFELSPLEKYMYLYNVVKMYKEYKEVEDSTKTQLSRYSEYTLFNDYMVCVGYAKLLEELVTRLGDDNLMCSTYNCTIKEQGDSVGHCRCMVKLIDEKYGISGIYISDPTWDSINYYRSKKKHGKTKINYKKTIADMDLYNHFLLTKEELMDEKVEYFYNDASDVLFKTNTKEKNEYVGTCFDLDNIKTVLKVPANFYDEAYSGIESESISKNIIVSAITQIYSNIYCNSKDNIQKFVDNTINNNITKQNKLYNNTSDKFGIKTKTKIKWH